MNKKLLIEQITGLCKEKGVSMHTAFVESGVGKNFKSNLKTSDPSNKNLTLLAKYFNVTIAYLLGEETTEDLTRRAEGLVIEWLNDNGYEVEQDENDTYTIGKDGRFIHMPSCDFAVESLKIKTASEDGFELAMEDWERRSFPAMSIEHSVNYLFRANHERGNFLRETSKLGSKEDVLITVSRIKALMSEKVVTWKQVSEELKIGKNQLKYWKENETLPDGKTLIKLSRYFNVSVDYLLGNEERNATASLDSDLTEQEKTLLAVYRASSEEVKLRIIQAVMNIKDESEKTHRVYRAARSSDNAEPAIVTRSQEDIDRLRNAKAVTRDEDL